MRYFFVIDHNLSTYYLSGNSLLEALNKGNLPEEEVESYSEIGVEDYIHKPIETPDKIDPDKLSPTVDPNLCPDCEIGTIERVQYPHWLLKHARYFPSSPQDYEYCNYCDYISLDENVDDIPYHDNVALETLLPY
ncbi:hypothetical protein WEU38_12010 [Cyanobacterium aponinum AL20118]|uniref:Uncharacterized protein n=1 Tax=Cyanobacterium aponinum AL20115 TaxID=3090662 RepID=A0AAF1C4P1_9CHRO|nr:hypothetical protein [Cyanobacterium aponinum]WPF87536.1 hypothetical protein SAY89_12045 [Cyanobacterium aponinum AL20115]